MKISGKFSKNLNNLRSTMKKRVSAARTAMGDSIARRVVEEVLSNIPNKDGWFKIYRDAISFERNEDTGTWVVQGEADIDLTTVDAETSLASFAGGNPFASILAQGNLWPIDVIPNLTGGINATLTIKAANATEISARREFFSLNLGAFHNALADAGAKVNENKRAIVNGRVIADLVFLSKRLEYGLGGFEKSAHWRPAYIKAKRDGDKWVLADDKAQAEIQKAFEGDQP